uniref:Uncharacterized protein n=1 Tax=Megaviridae environmental sample TaxID=1737588 RepID=A0A5J6VHC3_9VIRU|nr:MAG: hypothetical protein [Megaviridae environmental sample]
MLPEIIICRISSYVMWNYIPPIPMIYGSLSDLIINTSIPYCRNLSLSRCICKKLIAKLEQLELIDCLVGKNVIPNTLTELYMKRCSMTKISNKYLLDNMYLEKLSIIQTPISNIICSKHLQYLYISGVKNKIFDFSGIPNLKSLLLTWCDALQTLTLPCLLEKLEIYRGNLINLKLPNNLKELVLKDLRFSSITINHLNYLERLDLTAIPITSITLPCNLKILNIWLCPNLLINNTGNQTCIIINQDEIEYPSSCDESYASCDENDTIYSTYTASDVPYYTSDV